MRKSGWSVSPSPFLLTHPTISRMSLVIGLTLLPHIILLAVERNFTALSVIALSVAGSMLAELCIAFPSGKNKFGDGTAILAGILSGLLLPVTIHPLLVFLATFTGMLAARVLFGGPGSYWMNPVATVVSIVYISQASSFPPFLINADGVQTVGDAFGALRLDHFSQLSNDHTITASLNTFLLNFFGIKLPEGYITLFWNSPSPIPAFRYNIITLASSVLLIAMNIIDWIIPLFFLFSYGLSVWIFSLLPFGTGFFTGDILFALLTSGVLFVAFYVLPDYTTTPRTQAGKAISGIIAGIIAFMLCGPGGSPVGAAFTIVIANTVNPLIEYIENRHIATQGFKHEYAHKV
jgi:electron transport complex protein RnfD